MLFNNILTSKAIKFVLRKIKSESSDFVCSGYFVTLRHNISVILDILCIRRVPQSLCLQLELNFDRGA